MDMNGYQEAAAQTAFVYRRTIPSDLGRVAYTVLALNGEAGEAANMVKKILRGDEDSQFIDGKRAEDLRDELGDCLWYVAMAADELGFSLAEVADANVAKLRQRHTLTDVSSQGEGCTCFDDKDKDPECPIHGGVLPAG